MSAWDNEALAKIAAAEEVRIASVRPDGTLRKPVTVWVVRHGDDLYSDPLGDAVVSGSVVPRKGTRVGYGRALFSKTSRSSTPLATSTTRSMLRTAPSTADTPAASSTACSRPRRDRRRRRSSHARPAPSPKESWTAQRHERSGRGSRTDAHELGPLELTTAPRPRMAAFGDVQSSVGTRLRRVEKERIGNCDVVSVRQA